MHAANESFQFCICNPVAPSLLAMSPPFAEATAVPEEL